MYNCGKLPQLRAVVDARILCKILYNERITKITKNHRGGGQFFQIFGKMVEKISKKKSEQTSKKIRKFPKSEKNAPAFFRF